MIDLPNSNQKTSHGQRKAHVEDAIQHQSPPDFRKMSDEELYRYALQLNKVTILENELLHRLEQKLEDEDGDYA